MKRSFAFGGTGLVLVAIIALGGSYPSGPQVLHATTIDPLTVPFTMPAEGCNYCTCCLTCDLMLTPSGPRESAPMLMESHSCQAECGDEECQLEEDSEANASAMEDLWDVALHGTADEVLEVVRVHRDIASINLLRGSIQVKRCNTLAGNFPLSPAVLSGVDR